MTQASLAERLLRCVTTRDRASELVGDLLESCPAGRLRFWLMIAGLLIAVSWRTPVSFLFALLAGVGSLIPFLKVVQYLMISQRLNTPWVSMASRYNDVGLLLWMVAAFCLLRFGLRDQLSLTSLALSSLASTTVCLSWLANARVPLLMLTIGVFLFLMASEIKRRALIIALASLPPGILLNPRLNPMLSRAELFLYRGLHPHFIIPITLELLLGPALVLATCFYLHQRLLNPASDDGTALVTD